VSEQHTNEHDDFPQADMIKNCTSNNFNTPAAAECFVRALRVVCKAVRSDTTR